MDLVLKPINLAKSQLFPCHSTKRMREKNCLKTCFPDLVLRKRPLSKEAKANHLTFLFGRKSSKQCKGTITQTERELFATDGWHGLAGRIN